MSAPRPQLNEHKAVDLGARAAEMLLGAFMCEPDALGDVPYLQAMHFSEGRLRELFLALVRLRQSQRITGQLGDDELLFLLQAELGTAFERLGGPGEVLRIRDRACARENVHVHAAIVIRAAQAELEGLASTSSDPRGYLAMREAQLRALHAALDARDGTSRPADVAFTNLDAVAAAGIPAVDWLLTGWFAAGEIGLIAGAPKVGKSTLLYSMALHLAAGRTWMGHAVPRPIRVTIIQEDEPEQTAARRILRLAAAMGAATGAEVAPWRDGALRLAVGQGFRLDSEEGVARLDRVIQDHRSDLVVGDSVAKLFATVDEKDNSKIATVYRSLNALRARRGCGFLFSAHTTKASWPGSSRELRLSQIRGGGEHAAACDTLLWVERRGELRELSVLERREADAGPPVGLLVRSSTPEGATGPLFLDHQPLADAPPPSPPKKDVAAAAQLEHLALRGATRTRELDYLMETSGGSAETAKKARADLAARGLVRSVGRGMWEATAEGRSAIAERMEIDQ